MIHSAAGGGVKRAGALPARERSATRKMYGLIEIDPAGTVLYTRFEGGDAASFAALNTTGRNFYTEVIPFNNVGEFRQQLDNFSRGSQAAHCMDFTCVYEDGPLPVRILLARIRERSQEDVTKSVLVHIRRPQ